MILIRGNMSTLLPSYLSNLVDGFRSLTVSTLNLSKVIKMENQEGNGLTSNVSLR